MMTRIRRRALAAFSILALLTAGAAVAAPQFVDEEAEQDSLEGKKAPDFTLTTLDGQKVSLSKLKGKVVLLDFWASWCGPCRKSMPHMEETWQKYKAKGLVIVGVNVDKEADKAQKFLSGLKVSYPLALDPTAKIMGSYRVMQMPTAFIIDKQGVIRHKIVGFSDRPTENGGPSIAQKMTTQLEALLK